MKYIIEYKKLIKLIKLILDIIYGCPQKLSRKKHLPFLSFFFLYAIKFRVGTFEENVLGFTVLKMKTRLCSITIGHLFF